MCSDQYQPLTPEEAPYFWVTYLMKDGRTAAIMVRAASNWDARANVISRPDCECIIDSRERRVVLVDDGFQSHKLPFFANPIAIEGSLVKLQCAVPGKQYLFMWRRISDIPIAAMDR